MYKANKILSSFMRPLLLPLLLCSQIRHTTTTILTLSLPHTVSSSLGQTFASFHII